MVVDHQVKMLPSGEMARLAGLIEGEGTRWRIA
jgi:hypothetical protein